VKNEKKRNEKKTRRKKTETQKPRRNALRLVTTKQKINRLEPRFTGFFDQLDYQKSKKAKFRQKINYLSL